MERYFNKRLLTVRDMAHATGWKESTIRQKVWLREIEYVKLGRNIRFRPETIEDLIERNTIPALPLVPSAKRRT